MTNLIPLFEKILTYVVEICALLFEAIGVIILCYYVFKGFIQWVHHDLKTRLKLAQGIALSLEFKIGSEVLRTVVVHEWSKLSILAAVVILRGLLTFLIYWEIKNEKRELNDIGKEG